MLIIIKKSFQFCQIMWCIHTAIQKTTKYYLQQKAKILGYFQVENI